MVEFNTQNKPACCVGIWHLLAGILTVALGIYVWINPMVSLMALSLYIGVALIVIGIGYIATSVNFESGWYMFTGIIDIIIGAILVGNLGVTAATLPIIFAVWSMAVGAAQLVSAYRLKHLMLPWTWSLSLGILGIFFGFLIIMYPAIGAVTISTILGLYILIFGLFENGEYFTYQRFMKLMK